MEAHDAEFKALALQVVALIEHGRGTLAEFEDVVGGLLKANPSRIAEAGRAAGMAYGKFCRPPTDGNPAWNLD